MRGPRTGGPPDPVAALAAGSGTVVRTVFWRRTPCQPCRRISRSTVDLATGMPSRCRWAHIFTDPYSDSGLRAAVFVGFVEAGQDLGDGGVPQGPLRGRPHRPGVEGTRGDRHAVLAEHAADRSDPEAVPVARR